MSVICQNDEWIVHLLKSSRCFDYLEKWVVVKFSCTEGPAGDYFICYDRDDRGELVLKEAHEYEELDLPCDIEAFELKISEEIPEDIKCLLPRVEEYIKKTGETK